jgi:hypothetical protein
LATRLILDQKSPGSSPGRTTKKSPVFAGLFYLILAETKFCSWHFLKWENEHFLIILLPLKNPVSDIKTGNVFIPDSLFRVISCLKSRFFNKQFC